MIKLSSESYCIEAHKVGANTSALKYFIETYASSRGGWKGPLTWMATAFYPAINAMAYVTPFPLCIFVTSCAGTATSAAPRKTSLGLQRLSPLPRTSRRSTTPRGRILTGTYRSCRSST